MLREHVTVPGAPTRTRRLSNGISWLLLATPRRGVGHFIFVISNSSQINLIGLRGHVRMAMAWNENDNLGSAITIGSARKDAKDWAKSFPN